MSDQDNAMPTPEQVAEAREDALAALTAEAEALDAQAQAEDAALADALPEQENPPEPTPLPVAPPEPVEPPKPAASKPKPKPRKKAPPKETNAEKLTKLANEGRRTDPETTKAARAKGSKKSEPTPPSAELLLAHAATSLAVKGKKDADGKIITKGFGAPVNTTQIGVVQKLVKGKNILQLLGNPKLKDLKAYAQGDIKLGDLPDKTRAMLKEHNRVIEDKLKMWPRKEAAILVTLHDDRQKSSRKAAAKKPTPIKEGAEA